MDAELSEARASASSQGAFRAPWTVWAGGALVAGLTLIVFLPSLQIGFVNWDDVENFLTNPYYRGLGWPNLRWMFSRFHLGHYIPVTWLTLGLDYVLWGMDPRGYHLTSLVLHAINAVLFYLLTYRLLSLRFTPSCLSPGEGKTFGRIDSRRVPLPLGAAVAALLFSVHPLRVESVTWITERRDLVAGLFSLLTVHAYLTAYRRGARTRLSAGWYAAAVGLFGLALLSKSIVVGLPLALLALDLYPLQRIAPGESRSPRRLAQLTVEKIPFLLLSAATAVAMLHNGRSVELMTPLDILGVRERLAISSYGLVFYLWKTVVPSGLSPIYELHYPVLLLSLRYSAAIAAVAAITAGAIAWRRRWPAGPTAWFVYVALLLPVIGIVHNGYQIAADRYTYLACLAWPVLAGAAVTGCVDAALRGVMTRPTAAVVILLAGTAILGLTVLTFAQIRFWRDPETFWRHALAVDPESAFARFHLANTLTLLGKPDAARVEYERALALLPDRLANTQAVFHTAVGVFLERNGDVTAAERHYRTALQFSEDNVVARTNLGAIYERRGELTAALDSFLHVLRVLPGYVNACLHARHLATRLGVAPRELDRCPKLERGGGSRSLALNAHRGPA